MIDKKVMRYKIVIWDWIAYVAKTLTADSDSQPLSLDDWLMREAGFKEVGVRKTLLEMGNFKDVPIEDEPNKDRTPSEN